jgi:hypothetical protein
MQEKINSVIKYLDLDSEGKKINIILYPLFCFEAMSCILLAEKINLIITASLAGGVFIIMLIWRMNINVNSKSLFLYLGVGMGLYAFSFILIALALSIMHINLFWSCIVVIILLLISIRASIYIVKSKAREIIVDGPVDIKLPEYYKGAGAIGMLMGTLLLKVLGFYLSSIIMFFFAVYLANIFIRVATAFFYKHIIRNRYNIDELLKQSNIKPKAKTRR